MKTADTPPDIWWSTNRTAFVRKSRHDGEYVVLAGVRDLVSLPSDAVHLIPETSEVSPAPVSGGDTELPGRISRAVADPGAIIPREKVGDPADYELVAHWQTRAVLSVVAPELERLRGHAEQLASWLYDEPARSALIRHTGMDPHTPTVDAVSTLLWLHREASAEVEHLREVVSHVQEQLQDAWSKGTDANVDNVDLRRQVTELCNFGAKQRTQLAERDQELVELQGEVDDLVELKAERDARIAKALEECDGWESVGYVSQVLRDIRAALTEGADR